MHAGTPTVTYADSLRRSFLTIAHNRFARNNATVDERYSTRVAFDIDGNQRAVTDAADRLVMRYDYDMPGTVMHQASMEAGERWLLNDAAGRPIYAWDSRDHRLRTIYDALHRPVASFLIDGADPERLVERTVYGETRADAEVHNLRGQVVQSFDQAGVVTTEAYDFKGNLLATRRQLARIQGHARLGVGAGPGNRDLLEQHAVRRAQSADVATAPDGSIYRPTFNEANLLERVDVNLGGASTPTAFVVNIDYNARGQRILCQYGNGVETRLRLRAAEVPSGQPRDEALVRRRAAPGSDLHVRPDGQHHEHRGRRAADDLLRQPGRDSARTSTSTTPCID